MAKPIKLFKLGKAVAMSGQTYNFSEAELKACAAAYNPELHAAPLVIGHPKHDDPKYGQIQAISFADDLLSGDPANVDPQFAELVNSGKYDRVSASFYAPDSPSNPVPGVLYLRHVGFLGATPPGCKGLGAVSFAEKEEGIIEFGDWNDMQIARMFRSLRNWMIEKFGLEDANKALDEWSVQDVADEAARPDPVAEASLQPAFAEPNHKGGDATMMTPEELKKREEALIAGETSLKADESKRKHTSNLEFAEGLVAAGKLLATQKAALVGVLDFAAGVTEGDTIEFGEGEAKKNEAPLATLKSLFGAMPKVIEFGELGNGDVRGAQQKAIPGDLSKYV